MRWGLRALGNGGGVFQERAKHGTHNRDQFLDVFRDLEIPKYVFKSYLHNVGA